MKIISGHQPVYLPWLGLFHKIALCDEFVFMDDVQYLRQDWNNRNKIKGSHGAFWLTVPVSLKQSASELIKDIQISQDGWGSKKYWQNVHWNSIETCYRRAPHWARYADELQSIYLDQKWELLAPLNRRLLTFFLTALEIKVSVVCASEVGFDGTKSDLVLDHCKKLNGSFCVLGTHGRDYLEIDKFSDHGIGVYFQDYKHPEYDQLFGQFVSHLSALDLLFNCGPNSREVLLSGNISKVQVSQMAVNQEGQCRI